MSFESIGSIRRIAAIVWGAAGSQRALKWRSPTLIRSRPKLRAMPGGYVPDAAAGTPPPTLTPTISTHVLDTGTGQPAAGVQVALYKLGEDDRPIRLTQALTDADGRVRDLLERPMSPGTYRLEFRAGEGFFRRLSVDIAVEDVSRSYHVPLLLSPFSMTTYRGS